MESASLDFELNNYLIDYVSSKTVSSCLAILKGGQIFTDRSSITVTKRFILKSRNEGSPLIYPLCAVDESVTN